MQLVKVGAAVLNQTPLAWDGNRANIVAAIEAARHEGVSILCLPELCITGYGCEDAFLSPGTRRMAWRMLDEIKGRDARHDRLGRPAGRVQQRALQHRVPARRWPHRRLHRQAILGRRRHPLRAAVVQALARRPPRDVRIEDADYPLGDLYFDCGGVRIGFEICEDAWVANRPGSGLSLEGVDVILNPSASHFAFGKDDVRERFVLEGSRAFGVSYVYANLLGNEAGRAIYDGGALIASAGKMVAAGPRFSFADWRLTTAVVDLDATRLSRAAAAVLRPTSNRSRTNVSACRSTFLQLQPRPAAVAHAEWETGEYVKEEEFARAIALALFDYLRKSRSHGFVVSLSGGADSASVACLVAMLVRFGVAELGLDGFKAKLGYLNRVQGGKSAHEIVGQLLSCVYQSTRNSSQVTLNAARGVAEAIGAEFLEFDVDELVAKYTSMVAGAIGRELRWETDDIALQNIQARVRAPGVWMLANLRGALLLSTSNRSEAAVGYATMDGDTAGGLSPIAGIDKAFLRRWLRWLETTGPEGLGPIPALRAVNEQDPTAELRPQAPSRPTKPT